MESALVPPHIHAYWDIKAYLGFQAYSQPCHFLSPGIFWTRCLFKTLWNVDQAYSEPYNRGALFSHIQNLVQCLHMQKPGILVILLAYSCNIQNASIIASCHIDKNLWTFTNIQNSGVFKTWHIFRTVSKFKIEFFFKNS